MAQRKLVLRKETLTELSDTELTQVVGASTLTCSALVCLTGPGVCHNSDFQECESGNRCA